ncbi:MAG: aminotransferase class V-fold PLP-dependent enzyme, partial [Proteobacteria bacterium]|nr:aminotransferase class V-fold PLP-dependent enzyme [Pseudomonadota bacterium]
HYANAGRGVCARAAAVDEMAEKARAAVAKFIGAARPDQIVFTGGTTDGMNRIPRILKLAGAIAPGAGVIVSDLDHHSARLPWEDAAQREKCKIVVCPLDDKYNLDIASLNCPPTDALCASTPPKGGVIAEDRLLPPWGESQSGVSRDAVGGQNIDVFVITAMSNVLGVPQDVKKLVARAKKINPDAITIVDAAQYVAHLPIDVTDWGCDFLCFSGHKIGADTGIGVMYIKNPEKWPADKLGGGMVSTVSAKPTRSQSIEHRAESIDNVGARRDAPNNATSEWTVVPAPAKFEAGTLPLTQIAGLGMAINERSGGACHPSWGGLSPEGRLGGASSNKIINIKNKNLSAKAPPCQPAADTPPLRGGDATPCELLNYLRTELSKIPRIKFVSPDGAHLLTFVVDGMHVLDFGAMIGARGVCLRVGNMCASWLHARLGLPGTIRISVGPWNTMVEMKEVVKVVNEIVNK